MNPNVIVNNSEHFPLTDQNFPIKNINYHNQFWLKDNSYSLKRIFDAKAYKTEEILNESFVGGSFYQGFLNPWIYHRWHAPVSGIVERVYCIPGHYYYSNPYLDLKYQQNYFNSQPIVCATSTRQIYIIKADNPKIGRVGIIEIGMAEVSGCRNRII